MARPILLCIRLTKRQVAAEGLILLPAAHSRTSWPDKGKVQAESEAGKTTGARVITALRTF